MSIQPDWTRCPTDSRSTGGAVDEFLPGLPEVDIDDAVEDEVESEVDRLKDVRGNNGGRDDLDVVQMSRVVVELEHLGGSVEEEEHADDGDQGRGHATSGRRQLRVHAVQFPDRARLFQPLDQVVVAIGEQDDWKEKTGDRPDVGEGRFEVTVEHEHALVEEEYKAGWRAVELEDLVGPEEGKFEQEPDREGDRDCDASAAHADQISRLDRSTDGRISSGGHDDRQPRARVHESVLQIRTVDLDELQQEAVSVDRL